MGVITKKFVVLESGDVGEAVGVQLSTGVVGKAASVHDIVTVVCDFEQCKKGMFSSSEKGRKTIIIDKADELPPEAWKVLTLTDFNDKRLVFCSAGCLVRHLQTEYKPLKMPGNILEFPNDVPAPQAKA